MEQVSDADIRDIANKLSIDELKFLYVELKLEYNDIEKAEQCVGAAHYNLQAASVLRLWRQINGQEATRQQIIIALGKCRLTDAKEALQKAWGLKVHEIRNVDGEHDDFVDVARITVCANGDIALVDHCDKGEDRVYLLGKDRKCQAWIHKCTLVPYQSNPGVQITSCRDLAVTLQGYIAVVDGSKYLKFIDIEAVPHLLRVRPLCLLGSDEPAETAATPYSVAVALNGDVFVGDIDRKRINIHDGINFGKMRRAFLQIKPHFLASMDIPFHILVCDEEANIVQAISYSGSVVFTLKSFSVNGKSGIPQGLACRDGNIYLAVTVKRSEHDEAGPVNSNEGHIHQYSYSSSLNSCTFVQCCIKDLHSPRGIALHDRSLYVASKNSVVIVTL